MGFPLRQDTSLDRRLSAWKTDSEGAGASSPLSATRSSWCRPAAGPIAQVARELGIILLFSCKVGQGIGGAIAAFGIGVGGYVAGAPTQAPEALDAIRHLTGWGPALFVGIEAAIMLAYPLTEERFQEVVRQITLARPSVRVAATGLGAGGLNGRTATRPAR
jgi:hypothetical protein